MIYEIQKILIELICRKHLNLKFLVHFRVTCHQMSNKCVFITCINELFYLAELTKKTHIETSNRCNTCQIIEIETCVHTTRVSRQ